MRKFLYKKSNGVYHLYFQDPVTDKRRSVSTKTTIASLAKNFRDTFIITAGSPVVNTVPRLEELQKLVLEYIKTRFQPSTQKIYKGTFKRLLLYFKNAPVKSITRVDIQKYLDKRTETVSKSMANIELVNMKAIFNLAVTWGIVNINPVAEIKLYSIDEKQKGVIETFEYETILNEIKKDIQNSVARCNNQKHIELQVFCCIIQFAYYTGCRLNEILNILKINIQLDERIINIVNSNSFRTKTGKARAVPIAGKLYEDLSVQLNKSNVRYIDPEREYLFTNKSGDKLERDYISKLFKYYVRKAGINDEIHFHMLRHTFITRLLRNGVDIYRVAKLAGHSSIETTKSYVHLVANDLRQAVDSL